MSMSIDEGDCAAAKAQLDAFHRGELTPAEVAALGRHLGKCRHCRCIQQYESAYLERLRAVGATGSCPEHLRARLNELLSNTVRDA